jgi:hypothetical protein
MTFDSRPAGPYQTKPTKPKTTPVRSLRVVSRQESSKFNYYGGKFGFRRFPIFLKMLCTMLDISWCDE